MKKPISLERVSLEQEVPLITLPVKGKIPDWINGTLIRNGPSKFEAGDKKIHHWFDGLAMLHAFNFNQGKVTYTNRFLRSEAYNQVFNKNSVAFLGFDCDPCRTIFKRFFTFFFPNKDEIHNANINVTKYANKYVALTEIPLPVEFDLKTLETKGVLHFSDRLPQDNCWETAHPHVSQEKRESINYIVKFGRKGAYLIFKLPEGSATREEIAEIPAEKPSYMHSFSVTENYVILSEYPFVINPIDILLKDVPFIENYHWKESVGTHFLVIEKSSGKVVGRYKTVSFFGFHHVNAYEKDNEIIVDIVSYPDAKIVESLAEYGLGINDPFFPIPKLFRYKINLDNENVAIFPISDCSFELPRINGDYDGKPYNYVYGSDLSEISSLSDRRCIYKLNVETQQYLSWSEAGCCPGEPVFVKSLDEQEEDNGVILCVVLDNNAKKSFLLVLDAKTFQEIGRADAPHHIPEGLHGQFFQ